jgi:succinate dehydrogenase/fumarate reductase flavoprotein subunit
MAGDLFSGKCMHGDIAFCEAQGSVRAFMNLVELGIPFPHDKFGGWPGYRTDNDLHSRAVSAGPETSAMMFRALAAEVVKLGIKVFNNHHCIALLTDNCRSKVIGALAINREETDPLKAFVVFNTTSVILGTGGPGDIYRDTVYPGSQTCSTGMAFKAGAKGQNLTESQFGIASLKFRWNLSGSYQQVVPRYFSTDQDGRDEREFLNPFFPDYRTLTRAIFLKGYQWPFDPEKIRGSGSSLIDLLVFNERAEKKRKVFLDFRSNPASGDNTKFPVSALDPEVRSYLEKSDALGDTPVERLRKINKPALELYLAHSIDLTAEPLEIGICAQHNNGGLTGNIWWESNLKHLFPVGEVNGSHGVKRPGGAALNAGQVGSFRAALFISKKYSMAPPGKEEFLFHAGEAMAACLGQANAWLASGNSSRNQAVLDEIRDRMSDSASIMRNSDRVTAACSDALSLYKRLNDFTGASTVDDLTECFRLADNCLVHLIYLKAIEFYIGNCGRSRGSFIVSTGEKPDINDMLASETFFETCRYNRSVEKNIIEISYKDNQIFTRLVGVRPIPSGDIWFEKVWKDYLEDNFIES